MSGKLREDFIGLVVRMSARSGQKGEVGGECKSRQAATSKGEAKQGGTAEEGGDGRLGGESGVEIQDRRVNISVLACIGVVGRVGGGEEKGSTW